MGPKKRALHQHQALLRHQKTAAISHPSNSFYLSLHLWEAHLFYILAFLDPKYPTFCIPHFATLSLLCMLFSAPHCLTLTKPYPNATSCMKSYSIFDQNELLSPNSTAQLVISGSVTPPQGRGHVGSMTVSSAIHAVKKHSYWCLLCTGCCKHRDKEAFQTSSIHLTNSK